MRRIDQNIKDNQFANLYLFTGSESYLIRQYLKRLKTALMPENESMNYNEFKENNADIDDYALSIIETANTLPFFSDKRLIIVEESGFFKKNNEHICDYINIPSESTYIVFVESEIDKRTRSYKAINEKGVIEVFNMPRTEEIQKWILSRIKKNNKQLQKRAFDIFLEYMEGSDMEYMDKELEKLISYTLEKDTIEESDVKDICSPYLNITVWDLIRSAAEKNKNKTLFYYKKLLESGEKPQNILIPLNWQLRQLLYIAGLKEQRLSVSEIAKKLSMSEGAVRKSLSSLNNLSKERIDFLIKEATKTDWKIKSGQISDRIGLELFIYTCLQN